MSSKPEYMNKADYNLSVVEAAMRHADTTTSDGYHLALQLSDGSTLIGAIHRPHGGWVQIDVPDEKGEFIAMFVGLGHVIAAWIAP